MKMLEALVFAFRKAIELAKDNNEPGCFFKKFPTGQCGHASDMLAQFLIDNGIGPVRYINGTYYGEDGNVMQAHTWLVVEDLVVDITADQFRYHAEPLTNDIPVYIGPMNEYYQLFDTTHGSDHEHFGLEHQWTNYHELKIWYKTILSYM
ncbi:MAG: hypothetical protein E7449_03025 [Ruminococcaceae bacterium]|nr:hypothetical protein [Oscillospiraceae bacterium]